ncbi:MAG: AAA family ATPase [Anaerolineae bacterium]|nr:AAA family ATPase [Anaerolineae bacterium]
MLQTLSTYIPMDRRQAIATGTALPAKAQGSALFADISGFTPLTDALSAAFGNRRGAEEVSRYLNVIYDGLIEEIHRYGGSVIGFSGDAVLCWFSEMAGETNNAPSRAVAAAAAMQRQMEHAPIVTLPEQTPISFALKIAVTTGTARRFVVGNPDVQLIDVLAGSIVDRLAQAEHVADKHEIVVDAPTLAQVQFPVELAAWRQDDGSDAKFAVVRPAEASIPNAAWQPHGAVDEAQLKAWLLPALRTRLLDGMAEFETELRPATSMFVRFHGIDFENDDEASSKLDAFVRYVQDKLMLYEGTLLQVSIGDKGSYLYIGFGAPIAHEDDALRAVSVALELRQRTGTLSFIQSVQIGIAQGIMRVGSYGGSLSRTYGVLGDNVNLAARLMQKAAMDEVIGTGRIQRATADAFMWHMLEHIEVKGKPKPIAVAKLLGKPQLQVDITHELGRLLGREMELTQLVAFFQWLQEERFVGVAYIYGESGMGKSRVVYDLKRNLRRAHDVHWLTCSADNLLRRSLYPIKALLREYFDQFERSSEEGNKERFAYVFDHLLQDLMPELQQRLQVEMPFLGALVDLHWPDSIYELSDPKQRFESTLWALRSFIEALGQHNPLVLHFENAHWLDAETKQLIQFLVKYVRKARWGVVITSRYPDTNIFDDLYRQGSIRHCTVELTALTAEAQHAFAQQVLGGPLSQAVSQFITSKTGGNPFFIEQLILDLRERGVLIRDADGVWTIHAQALTEVPVSISAVLMTRLDRLSPPVKQAVQYAAVLGQTFELPVLAHMLDHDPELMTYVEEAHEQSIWTQKDENVAEFQHPLLRDTAYDSQLQEQLKERHWIAAKAIEAVNAKRVDVYASDLAYHFGLAQQPEKERFYAHLAGEMAVKRYSNTEALRYINRALELTPAEDTLERYQLLLLRENVFDYLGERASQQHDLATLTELVEILMQPRFKAEVALRQASYAEVTSRYREAISAAERAAMLAQADQAHDVEAASLLVWGRAEGWQSAYAPAREHLWRALELAQSGGQYMVETACLRNLGIVAFAQGDYVQAETYQQAALKLSRSRGDRRGESHALTNLARIANQRNQMDEAQHYRDEALQLSRDTGDRSGEVSVLNLTQRKLGSKIASESRLHHEESLKLSRAIGNRRGECNALYHLGTLALEEGNHAAALLLLSQSQTLATEIGYRSGEIRARTMLARLLHERQNIDSALEQSQLAVAISGTVGARPEQANALLIYGYVLLAASRAPEAITAFTRAIQLWGEIEQPKKALEAKVGLAYAAFLAGEMDSTRRYVEDVLPNLENADIAIMTDPLRMYLTCFRLLRGLQDPRAADVLDIGYSLAQNQRAGQAGQKQTSVQRELMSAWIWNYQM